MNILLIGEESAGIQTLKLLTTAPHNLAHNLVGCMASPDKRSGGGLTLWQTSEKMGVRQWPAEYVKDASFAEVVQSENVDLILNVHSLFVIKSEIVDSATYGSYNLHPGPLPAYAGLNAPSWAIYHGEKRHGVTLHRMASAIDTGSITYQSIFDIEDKDTGFTLSTKCIRYGLTLIKQLLEISSINPSRIPDVKQDLTRRSYFGRQTPQDGWLDWSRPATEICNFVRAADYSPFSSPWINPKSIQQNTEVSFLKVTKSNIPTDDEPGSIEISDMVRVASADQWVEINKIIVNQQIIDPKLALRSGEKLTWKRA